MDKCPVCNINAPYGEHELCEECLNNMLLGGQSFTFVPDSNFFKEIGVEPNEYAKLENEIIGRIDTGHEIKKEYGKSVNSGEESGWIERQMNHEIP